MWRPGPNMRLPKEYRKNGIGFGDIGIIYRSEGSFLRLVTLSIREEYPITSNPSTLGRSKEISRKRLSMDEDIISQVHRCGKSTELIHRKSNLILLVIY